MKLFQMRSKERIYVCAGVTFGLCFPLAAWGLDLFLNNFTPSINAISEIHTQNPVHFIVDLAPFILGTVFYFLGRLHDASDARVAEQSTEKEQSQESFKALADNLPVFISLKDTEGRFQFVNKVFEKWVCVNSDDIIGKSVFELYPNKQALEFAAKDREAIDNQSIISEEVELSYPDGQTRTVISTRFPVLSSTDDVIGMGTINYNITEHKVAEREKNEFISTVSHELRTPLTSIKGALGLIGPNVIGKLPDDLKSLLDVANENCDRLILLINDILDVEKFEAGDDRLHMEALNVVSLIEDAIEANKGFGDMHGVTFITGALEKDTFVSGNKDRLMQVFSNLMSNAAKFSNEGECVEVSATRTGDKIRFNVKDYGSGIPKENQATIFEKFTQADSSDTRQKGGTGLGLFISKAIVEQHGGTIDFSSEIGIGSTFYISLPVSE